MTEILLPSGATAVEPAAEFRTFLFADIRGYTRFTQDRGDSAAARLVTKFARLMREGARARGGQVVEVVGDEVVAVFASARQALRAAVDLQARFARETAGDPELPLPVGIGIDAGEAVPLEGGYRGDAVNLASRLCNLARPGEVLASEGVVWLGRRLSGVSYAERGLVPLKGFADPVRVIRVVPDPALTVRADGDPLLEAGADAARPRAELPLGGFLGALPPGVLVGRQREWELIMSGLEDVLRSVGRLVMLSGEPGIGKTRLAQEVTVKAQHWHFLVATGRCYEQEQSVPYYPFLEALSTVYRDAPVALQIEIPQRWPYLGRLLPDVLGPTTRADSNGGSAEAEDQIRLFRAVTQWLQSISEHAPVAILLDDVHWADDSSLKLLQHIARNTRASRVFLLATYRDVEVNRQHPLERALLDLSREALVLDISVARLTLAETAALTAEIMGAEEDLSEVVELVYRRTGGNAFFIQEMLRALVERGDLYRKDGHWERKRIGHMEVPKSIRSVIGQRLSRIEERAQDILREASVFGQEFAFDDLLAMVESLGRPDGRNGDPRTEDIIDSALEQGIVVGLLRETEPERYAFNHALTQQALYYELSTRRRKRLHLAAARVMARLEGAARRVSAGELAWHFLEGDDPEQALKYALLAGDQAEEMFANGDAEHHYLTALELARELEDRPRALEALEKLAGVLAIEAAYPKALDLLEQGVAMYREAGDREGEACLVADMAHIHFRRGSTEEGISRVLPLVEAIEAEPGGTRPTYGLASLWASLARLYMNVDDVPLRVRTATRAVELARTVGDPRLLLSAEISWADALWAAGEEDKALQVLSEAIPRAEALGDLSTLARALGNTGAYYLLRGDLEKNRHYHEKALAVAERRGDLAQILLTLMLLSTNAFIGGHWEVAEVYIDRAELAVEPRADASLRLWPIVARGWLDLRRGRLDEAARLAQQALPMTQDDGDWYRLVHRLQAEIELLRGEPQAALACLEPLRDEPGWLTDGGFLATLAWAYLENERLEEADESSRQALSATKHARDGGAGTLALTVAGLVSGRRGQWEEAHTHLREALEHTRRMPLPFEEARALQAVGQVAALEHDAELARSSYREADAIYRRLGARKDIEIVAQALQDLGAAS